VNLQDGSFNLSSLYSGDLTSVYLAFVDNNGVKSSLYRTRRAEWIATKGGVAENNPHKFESRSLSVPGLRTEKVVEIQGDTGIFDLGGDQIVTKGGGSWKKMRFSPTPDPPIERKGAGMVHEKAKGKVIVFSGYTSSDDFDAELWQWDEDGWKLLEPEDPENDGNPSRRNDFGMVYDTRRDSVIIFGGHYGSYSEEINNEMWAWNGSSWKMISPTDPENDGNPSPRYSFDMVYDSHRDKIVLFGGMSADSREGDLWEWNGASWKKIMDTPWEYGHFDEDPCENGDWTCWRNQSGVTAPIPRVAHTMIFDRTNRKTMLFGGGSYSGRAGDLWQWDGDQWELIMDEDSSGNSAPKPRLGHSMVYNSLNESYIVYGGFGGGSEFFSDTWEWNGSEWFEISPFDPEGDGEPASLIYHSMIFNELRGETALFGGAIYESSQGYINQNGLWHFDSLSWREEKSVTHSDGEPLAPYFSAMAYDFKRGRAVQFGAGSGETWEWDGKTWHKIETEDPENDGEPEDRMNHAMVFDPNSEGILLFGGNTGTPSLLDDTWLWNGKSWRKIDTFAPSARAGHSMTFDKSLNAVVLFGGYDKDGERGDTWVWTGAKWVKIIDEDPSGVSSPLPRRGHSMIYDSERAELVLFGGVNGSKYGNDLWLFKENSWVRKIKSSPEDSSLPEPRAFFAMAYEQMTGKTLLLGGRNLNDAIEDMWQWDGEEWIRLTPVDPENDGNPPKLSMHAMVFDEVNSKMVLTGGTIGIFGNGESFRETWLFDSNFYKMPAQFFSVDFSAAGDMSEYNIDQVEVVWFAGADSYDTDDNLVTGALLRVWDEGVWKTVAESGGDAEFGNYIFDPEDAGYNGENWFLNYLFENSVDDPFLTDRIFTGSSNELNFIVTPKFANNRQIGYVATDYMQINVKYSMP